MAGLSLVLRVFMALVLVQLALGGPVAAQDPMTPQVTMTVVPAERLLGAESGTANVTIVLDCTLPEHAPPLPSFPLKLSAAPEPEWATATVQPEEVVFATQGCAAEGTLEQRVEVMFSVADDAIGGSFFSTTLEATDADGRTWTVDWEQEVDVVFDAVARLGKETEKAGQNARIAYPLIYENRGNTDVHATVELVEQPGMELKVIMPPPTTIPPGKTVTIPLDARTPYENGMMSRNDTFEIIVTFSTYTRPEIQSETRLTAHAETEGAYLPGPGVLVVLALLMGHVVHARRRTCSTV